MYHSVLWVPTIFHKHLTPLLSSNPKDEINYDNIEISDGMGKKFSYLNLTLKPAADIKNPAKRDIWIGYNTQLREKTGNTPEERNSWIGKRSTKDTNFEEKYEKILHLECLDARRNGLIQFCFELPENIDKDTHPLISKNKKLTHAVYHAIKEIFHEHEFHIHPKDSIINPFGSKRAIRLDEDDNPALLYYLSHFETTLSETVIDVSIAANKIKEKRNKGTGESLLQVAKSAELYFEKCSNVLGFGVYYRSLYFSKYNISFKTDCKNETISSVEINSINPVSSEGVQREIDKKHYQSAINIESCLNYINVIKIQFQDLHKSFTTKISLDNQTKISKAVADFCETQEKMHDTLGKLETLQDIASKSQSKLKDAILEVKDFQTKAQDTAKKWNKTSTVFAWIGTIVGICGILFAVFIYLTSTTPISRNDLETIGCQLGDSIIESKTQKLIYYTDSIIELNNKKLLDSIKSIETSNSQKK